MRRAAVRASSAPGDREALGLTAVVDHRSLLGMLKAVHFRAAASGSGGGGEGDGSARFHARQGREVFMITCKARRWPHALRTGHVELIFSLALAEVEVQNCTCAHRMLLCRIPCDLEAYFRPPSG